MENEKYTKTKNKLLGEDSIRRMEENVKKLQESQLAVLKTFNYQQQTLKGQMIVAEKVKDSVAGLIKPYYGNLANVLVESFKPVLSSSVLRTANVIKKTLSTYQFDAVKSIQTPMKEMLKAIDFSPIYSVLKQIDVLKSRKEEKEANEIVLEETLNAKWFPHALCVDNARVIEDFWQIIASTRKSQNRVKKMDKLILDYYGKTRIERMRKQWRDCELPNYLVRMMSQAVRAYYRKEYALTIVMLSTLWEGIIYNKLNDTRGRTGNRTKGNFKKLIDESGYDVLYCSFFEEFIMYDCRSVEQVIDDVPGRNSSAHSWYSKYPSRKTALNAILFTDFLLKLK